MWLWPQAMAVRWVTATPNKSPKRFSRWSVVANEAKAFDKRESANQYWRLQDWCGSWWQGEEKVHEWRLNGRVESEKWRHAAECGMCRGGWFIHGDTIIRHQSCEFTCCRQSAEGLLVHYFTTFFGPNLFSTDRKVKHVPSLPTVCFFFFRKKKKEISCVHAQEFFLFFCYFLDPTASTSLLPLTVPPSSFIFKPEYDLVMFWIRIHMYSTAQKSSLTNHCCWAQCVGNWAVLPWRVLSTVEMDVLMDRRRWKAWSVFFSVLKRPCISQPTGVKNSSKFPWGVTLQGHLRALGLKAWKCPYSFSLPSLSFSFLLSPSLFPSLA